jgi:hypothetical protein
MVHRQFLSTRVLRIGDALPDVFTHGSKLSFLF